MDYKLPKRFEESNKSTYGRVLNIAGSDYMPGAAYLSSISALKMGCGYCFLCSGEMVINSVAAKSSNIVFVPISQLKNHIKSSDVIEIGCGLSVSCESKKILKTLLKNVDPIKPLIIDADGLNILSKKDYTLPENTILTPHPKEMSRLTNLSVEDILNNPEKALELCVEKYNTTVLLKLHRTIIMDKYKNKYINTTGNSSLAKAGSGDVLSGIIGGLLAQGMNCFDASKLGVYIHGLTGEIASNDLSEYSVLASDLLTYIGPAFKHILNN